MDKDTKNKLKALIEAKKKNKNNFYEDKRNIYRANGEKRKGIKSRKQGGLFDK